MKLKHLWTLLVVSLFFIGCDDNTGSLGLDMLPDSDHLEVKKKTYELQTQSKLADRIYARTNIGYVGKFTDPDFGFYESGFLTQLNCTENLTFPEVYDPATKTGEMVKDEIYVTELILYYSTYFGDSLNACRMSVYELDERIDKQESHYTDIDPEKYKGELLARKAYTAFDPSISDSIRSLSNFRPYVRVPLSNDLGNRILKKYREDPENFKDADAFIDNVFKGIYVKSDYGDGTILYIEDVALNVVTECYALDSLGNVQQNWTEDGDSIYYPMRTFAATKEVIQANRFENSDRLAEKAEEGDWTYIKSPGGIYTQMNLPLEQVYDELLNDTINSVKLTFTAYQQSKTEGVDEKFQMQQPENLLLIREKELESFFEKNWLPDNVTSYIARFASKTGTYEFSNLSYLVNTCMAEKEEMMEGEGKNWTAEQWKAWEEETQWSSVVLVPITTNPVSYTSASDLLSIHHDMGSKYVKLKGGENGKNLLDMGVYYTKFY